MSGQFIISGDSKGTDRSARRFAVPSAGSRADDSDSAKPQANDVERRRGFVAGLWATALGTLASRVLGFVRDVATASLLGLGETAVMDAFVIAFRIPNLFRRLFGEGALTACYLPVLSEQLERDRGAAWRFASAFLAWLAVGLAALVVLGEALCAAGWLLWGSDPNVSLIIGLSAALLPYVWFICITAQLTATLQALSCFALPALGPALLNLCWVGGAWWLAPSISPDPRGQAFVLAGCILLAGLLQVWLQAWALWRRGFRFHCHLAGCRTELARVGHSLGPMLLGLSVVQLNTLLDSLIAWLLAMPAGHHGGVWWLGGAVEYPLTTGAAAAIYYGERFYQLPVGLIGTASATAIFPLLSRHAARRQPAEAAADLGQALRLVGFASLPIAVLLTLLAGPLVRLALERGQFSAEDTARTAHMVAAYASGIWAYCSIPLLVRGFYAWGDFQTPVRIAVRMVGLNLALNLILVWPLAEVGMAVSTSLTAAVQFLLLARTLQCKFATAWSSLVGGMWANLAATAALAGMVAWVDAVLPPAAGKWLELGRLAEVAGAGGAVFFLCARLLASRELTILLAGCQQGRRP
jgi:putative peptidoglycan lipid II flippase